jgi:hypothetical protein
MNILAKSRYKPLTRITNLDGQNLKQRATSLLSLSIPKAPQNERALPPLAKELAEIQPLLYIGPPEITEVPLH